MKVIVGDIIDNPGKSLCVNQDETVDIPELKLLTPVHVSLKMTGTGEGGITVKGKLTVQAELTCSRCAGLYAENLDIGQHIIQIRTICLDGYELKSKSSNKVYAV